MRWAKVSRFLLFISILIAFSIRGSSSINLSGLNVISQSLKTLKNSEDSPDVLSISRTPAE